MNDKTLATKEKFIILIDELLEKEADNCEEEVKKYWEQLKIYIRENKSESGKQNITELGKKIIKCMQSKESNSEKKFLTAKEIAEELFVSPKTVGGAMRKLIKDGYVQKIAGNPINYYLTDKGLVEEIKE